MRGLAVLCLSLFLAGCTVDADSGTHRLLVFFPERSAAIDAEAQGAIDAAAAVVKRHRGIPVTVIGYADPVGSAQANIDLSRTRAQVVYDALVVASVPPGQLSRQAKGATSFVEAARESRRVEIVVNGR